MAFEVSTGGGLFGDEEEETSAPSFGASGGGLVNEQDRNLNPRQQALNAYSVLQKRASDSAQSAYGGNAAQRWGGTPAIGLGIFKARNPIIGFGGYDRQGEMKFRKRIDASTRMANPPEGLVSGRALQAQEHGITGMGASLTPNDQWRALFPRYATPPSRPDLPGTRVGTSGVVTTGQTPGGAGRILTSGYGFGYAY